MANLLIYRDNGVFCMGTKCRENVAGECATLLWLSPVEKREKYIPAKQRLNNNEVKSDPKTNKNKIIINKIIIKMYFFL